MATDYKGQSVIIIYPSDHLFNEYHHIMNDKN